MGLAVEKTSFRSLRLRLLQPLIILSAIAAITAGLGVYWFENKALQSDLQQRGQLLSTALIISAETSSSLADFHRMVLAISSEPSIESIILLDLNYQPIFTGDSYDIHKHKGELKNLEPLIKQAKATGLSIGAIDSQKDYVYKVVSLINVSSLPQENIFKPEASLLLVNLHTEEAVTEALTNAAFLTALFFCIGLIAFSVIYYLINKLVLNPSQRIVSVMQSQSFKKNESTGFKPEHELGLIGQTFDLLAEKLNARKQALEQALIKAQDANTAKSQFLASMSHEIRTPMNGVIGMLHLLKEEPLNEKQTKYVTLAKSSADSLLSLINDILDVSKIEAGKLDIEIIDFDIRSLFSELVSSMTHRIKSQDLKLILEINNLTEQFVRGDPHRLKQILTNLLGNALKFTQQGEITIHAALVSSLNNNEEDKDLLLQCVVSDTGIGIPNDKVDQLFNSFTQADSSTTREYGGTGLGLSIAKQLCQLMGGNIKVSSQLGQGSQFSFEIQLSHSDSQVALQALHHNIESSNIELQRYKHQKILLVEDNAINQLVALGILENFEIKADIAGDGKEAIDILLQTSERYYSLILMDCQMPVMDGFHATRNIRKGDAGDSYRNIPIIALTANAMQGDREQCIQAGMSDYLTKPIDGKLLAACLSNWLTTIDPVAEIEELIKSDSAFHQDEIKIWDRSALMQRLGNQEQIMIKILQCFLQDTPELINKFEGYIKSKENAGLAEIAHTLKGVTANISASELHELSEKIENLIQQDLWDDVAVTWPELKISYQRLCNKIKNDMPI
ncbi:MAG: ATP-binding protein [Oleispira sp.]